MPKAIESPVDTTFQNVDSNHETSETSETEVKRPRHSLDIKDQVKTLFLQSVKLDAISSETGVKQTTIRTWINRGGWLDLLFKSKAKRENIRARVLSISPAPQSGASSRVRDKLANVIERQIDALAEVKPKSNIKAIRRFGKAVEPLTRSLKIVHGWGNESIGGVVVAELLGHEREQHEPQASIAITADVRQLPCGPDTPTGSVPAPCGFEQIPQEAK